MEDVAFGALDGRGAAVLPTESILETLSLTYGVSGQEKLPREAYEWYLDLRRYGACPSAGFGLGLERVVAWICGLDHAREAAAFPRTLNKVYP